MQHDSWSQGELNLIIKWLPHDLKLKAFIKVGSLKDIFRPQKYGTWFQRDEFEAHNALPSSIKSTKNFCSSQLNDSFYLMFSPRDNSSIVISVNVNVKFLPVNQYKVPAASAVLYLNQSSRQKL